jgi:hypothetical protein
MEGRRIRHWCYYCKPPKSEEGNLVMGFPDATVTGILSPLILSSETDARGRLEVMLKLRLLSKAWKLAVIDTDEWFDHFCSKPGFNLERLWSEFQTTPESSPPRLCTKHPIITLDEVLTDP